MNAFLDTDESFIYLMQDENPQGDRLAEIVTESTHVELTPLIQDVVQDLDVNFYAKGRVHAIPDLHANDRSAQQAKGFLHLGYQATIMTSIHIKQEFWGLLIVNQKQPRQWQRQEIHFLEQIVFHIGIALQQAMLCTQLELANQQLRQMASVDGLTQVANHRHFDENLQTEWRRMRREQEPLAVIICDVDYFKLYNDAYGHQAGDDCLIAIAQILKNTIKRPGDLIARHGGDKFVILLPNTKLAGACQLAEAARCNLETLKLEHQASKTSNSVSISLGVASCIPQDYSSPDALLKDANQALYEAKENGRNQWLASGLEAALEKVY
ncbi:MAG: diguanylate cyclase [Acaryochloridaceae cyanobacterium RL_2_7]|nr:diguanylate cyclase [Acaryochloridaceae cyanobacterium RL_2_7]